MNKQSDNCSHPNWFTRFVAASSFAVSYFFVFFALVSCLNEYMGFNLLNSVLYNWSFVGTLATTICLRTLNSDNYFYNSWRELHMMYFICIFLLFLIAIYFVPGLREELFYFLLKV